MKQATATPLAFVIATMLPAAYLALVSPLTDRHDLLSVFGSFLIYGPFAGTATLMVAVPIYLVLKRFQLVNWWSAIGSGAIAGAITAAALASNFETKMLLTFALLGVISGAVFWLIWKTGRA